MKICPDCGPEPQPEENFYRRGLSRATYCIKHWNARYRPAYKPRTGVRNLAFKLPVNGIELVVSLSERREQAKAFGDANALREIAAEYASRGATRTASEILSELP